MVDVRLGREECLHVGGVFSRKLFGQWLRCENMIREHEQSRTGRNSRRVLVVKQEGAKTWGSSMFMQEQQ
jgi:hypothetical protein